MFRRLNTEESDALLRPARVGCPGCVAEGYPESEAKMTVDE